MAGAEADADSDEELARRVQSGDREALEQLVRRYVRPVHAVVASFLPDPTQVEDAAQEAFLRALRALHQYDPHRPFAPWLYQIARNVARNQSAAQAVRRTEPLPADGPASPQAAPDLDTERAEIRARVDHQVALLPEQRRTAFRLVDVDGMSAEEAGRIMGLSAGTIRAHLHNARKQLREALTEYAAGTKGHGG
ncbi:MAG: sigma-70 family RNA polymerase sigma factor [Longimicrobiales bacterium]